MAIGSLELQADNIWKQKSKVVDTGEYLEITGTVPSFPAGEPGGCGMEDLKDPTGEKMIIGVCAHIDAKLPPNTALQRAELFARKTGSGEWLKCGPNRLDSAEYQHCLTLDPVIKLDNGMTGKRWCSPVQRDTCGDDKYIDFSLGTANFSCANLGEQFRELGFMLSHISRTSSYDYQIRAYYQKCGENGSFESN